VKGRLAVSEELWCRPTASTTQTTTNLMLYTNPGKTLYKRFQITALLSNGETIRFTIPQWKWTDSYLQTVDLAQDWLFDQCMDDLSVITANMEGEE
jgi:hypothetical protein